MKHRLKIVVTAIAIITAPITVLRAEEYVPIPQKRPDKLKVSPTYIKQLMERQKKSEETQEHEKQKKSREEFKSLFDQEIEIEDTQTKNIDAHDIVELLERDALISQSERLNTIDPAAALSTVNDIPIPQKKPVSSKSELLAESIKTVEKKKNNNSAVISFTLQPNQVKLDYDLQSFLSDHALEIT